MMKTIRILTGRALVRNRANRLIPRPPKKKAKVGLTGRGNQLTAHLRGNRYNISAPDVKAIRESLGLTQEAFAARFHLSQRTIQQWEQRRALPDQPARILLKAIEQAPDVIAQAASAVERDMVAAAALE